MINDIIVDRLQKQGANIILIFDPDDLFGGEDVLNSIYQLGFSIIEYEDPEVFRYYYETNIRNILDAGGRLDKRLIIKYTSNHTIPYDIQQRCDFMKFSLREIFPKLSYSVIRELYSESFDKVYAAYGSYYVPTLGDRGTRDFILNKAYGIVLERIDDFQELVRVFMPFYYRGEELPDQIAEYAIEILEQKKQLRFCPISEIVGGKRSFFQFIQKQWEGYTEYAIGGDAKVMVDFKDPSIKPYMDNLFQENILTPVKRLSIAEYPDWMRAGLIYDEEAKARGRFKEGLRKINDQLKKISSYRDWYAIADVWADISVLIHDPHRQYSLDYEKYMDTRESLNQSFKDWLFSYYGRLSSLSYAKEPAIVHKIPWHISYSLDKRRSKKAALILMDGMSLDNWYIFKEGLDINKHIIYRESLCFAWIPTITSVSRQAIFSGEPPANFPDTLLSTSHDERRWSRFWKNRGYADENILYRRGIKDFREPDLKDIIDNDRIKILGLVVNTIDDIMHGQQLSIAGMYQDIRLWARDNYFREFLECLLSKGYDVFIASDHGNTDAMGQGNPREGLAVEKSSTRLKLYSPNKNYDYILSDYKAFEWNGSGLPPIYSYILCEENYAFIRENERIVSHGGMAIEEVIVPFIHIRKED